ncbi:MAG: ABC transporter substrate-binding protein [Deltaproteobacteria bacterium]|nr:MAG: ABC transporter substrate-binding protein [Deltaproteobacteria bacterium]
MRHLLPLLALLAACRVELGPPGARAVVTSDDEAPAGEVWIYTSMYQSVIDQVDPLIREALPGVEPQWYQAGSEKVAQRVEAEWDAGGSKACLLMTSDPFWYAAITRQDRLQPHFAPNVLQIDRGMVDPSGYWATARISLLVLGAHEDVSDAPTAIGQLGDPDYAGRVSIGDPLSSGTMFTLLSFLTEGKTDDASWSFVEELRGQGLVSAGGNSSVLTRLETREREIGVLLLENLLKAAEKDSPAKPIYPADGAIAVPGPIALTSDCPNPKAARAVYDFLLSDPGQQAMVDGNMYAGLPHLPPPKGAEPLDAIALRPWDTAFRERVAADKAAIKERFAELVSGAQ